MNNTTYEDVKQFCVKGRFFPYDHWHDRLFVPSALVLAWVFVRLGVSGNAVSWLSGGIAIAGATCLSFDNPYWVVIGSFGYIIFYLLDYVDGAVARFRGEAGMGGQYVDWVIHILAAVGTMAGLVGGALQSVGFWIFPFGILAIIASALTTARFSIGWFAVCMERQQRRAKGRDLTPTLSHSPSKPSVIYWVVRSGTTAVFHENYIIFSLPILALLQFIAPNILPDFRVVLVILGGTAYFFVMVSEVQRISRERGIDEAYRKVFVDEAQPNLPEDHFF
jgi:hypothetical protein